MSTGPVPGATDDHPKLRERAREFADECLRPAAAEIREAGATGTDQWEYVEDAVREGTERGFTTTLVPEPFGGPGMSLSEHVVVMEECGAADIGLATAYFNLVPTAGMMLAIGGTDDQRERFMTELAAMDAPVVSGALNEPSVAGSDLYDPDPDPDDGIQTTAKRDGDGYVIDGRKARFVANAGLADYYFVVTRTDLSKPQPASTSVFLVPGDTPGLSVGKRGDLLGWEASVHGELHLDGVRVPADHLIGREEGTAARFMGRAMPFLLVGYAACFVGLAREAYERAHEYAGQRESWGQPIAEHQTVSTRLADMRINTRAARRMVEDAAAAIEAEAPDAAERAFAAKTFVLEKAIENAEAAVRTMGGYGVTADSDAARYLRDAWTGDPVDGTQDVLRLAIMQDVRRREGTAGESPGEEPRESARAED
jgi:alkylation response protein AidB-like acyl-CoA dehydrogenase